MIVFPSAGAWLRALTRLKVGKAPAALVASHYVLVEQEEPGRVALTMVEPGQYEGTLYLPTLEGGVCSRYLLHPDELEEVLRQIDAEMSVTLRPAAGGALLETALGYRLVSAYAELSHFVRLPTAKRLLARVSGRVWREGLRRVARFSGLREADVLQAAYWTLRGQPGELLWMAPTPQVAVQTYLYEVLPAQTEFAGVLSGRLRHLRYLRDLGEEGDVELYYEEGWLTAVASEGRVTVQVLAPDLTANAFLGLLESEHEVVGRLQLFRVPLLGAVKLQRPGSKQRNPYLRLGLEGTQLCVSAFGNLHERSVLQLNVLAEWPDVCVSGAGLLTVLEASVEAQVELQLRRFRRADGVYAHYIWARLGEKRRAVLPVRFPHELEALC
jgi:hypothetical protein